MTKPSIAALNYKTLSKLFYQQKGCTNEKLFHHPICCSTRPNFSEPYTHNPYSLRTTQPAQEPLVQEPKEEDLFLIFNKINLKDLETKLRSLPKFTTPELQLTFWAIVQFINKSKSEPLQQFLFKLRSDALNKPKVMTNLFYTFICLVKSTSFQRTENKFCINDKELLKEGLSYLFQDRGLFISTKQYSCIFLTNVFWLSGVDIMKEIMGW